MIICDGLPNAKTYVLFDIKINIEYIVMIVMMIVLSYMLTRPHLRVVLIVFYLSLKNIFEKFLAL
ncbi:hypothetical protein LS73_005735 [Helicobacter muridarum]|uniref:Uncharacterized protein n=1 Tax=Helicobacter muridarum TaxID=216 RepID=A0A4V6I3H3_9HELI|nr:hypothetical protein [Helicobacter muridarum]TLE00033.1 hypothetical protein LS73_005735 [Helicobacter muridarum]